MLRNAKNFWNFRIDSILGPFLLKFIIVIVIIIIVTLKLLHERGFSKLKCSRAKKTLKNELRMVYELSYKFSLQQEALGVPSLGGPQPRGSLARRVPSLGVPIPRGPQPGGAQPGGSLAMGVPNPGGAQPEASLSQRFSSLGSPQPRRVLSPGSPQLRGVLARVVPSTRVPIRVLVSCKDRVGHQTYIQNLTMLALMEQSWSLVLFFSYMAQHERVTFK